MKRIVSFYYLKYPDRMPADPSKAFSEVYVELGDERSDLAHFHETYAFHVYTIGYLNDLIRNGEHFLVGRAMVVIDRFDDRTIERALESVLANMEEYGIRK